MKYEIPNKEIIISEYERLIKNNTFNMTITLINFNYKYLKKDKKLNFRIEREIYTDLGEEVINWAILETEVNRIEIINQSQDDMQIGRIFNFKGDMDVQFQDGGKTIRIFI